MSKHEYEEKDHEADSSKGPFGPSYVVHPETEHLHTAILLHGRGSTGKEFADDFFASTLSAGQNLQEKMPGWRWVFPSSRELWSTAFQEDMTAWFEAHSLTEIAARQDLQVDGICESVRYIQGIVEDEIKQLDGNSEKLVLGGISQGGAVGLWTLLCGARPARRLGGFIGASTWLPFATNIERVLASNKRPVGDEQPVHEGDKFDSFVATMMPATIEQHVSEEICSLTPVFLGHGVDDAYVDVELGRQAARVLLKCGMTVEWKEYSGAEEEGHWLKVPEEMDDIFRFLNRPAHAG